MAEHQELRASKKSKSLFGKLHRKGKMRYQQVVLDDEEHLMCDDKHETNNDYTVKMQSNDKAEDANCVTRKHQNGNERPVKEGSTLETEIREAILEPNSADRPSAYHSGKQLTDINLFESDIISAAVIPENACVVKVNAIIESSNDNNSQRYLEESEAGFLVTANELYKSDTSLLQNEKSIITSHFDNLSVSHAGTSAANEEVLKTRANADVDHESGDGPYQARISRAKENSVKFDNVEESPMSEPIPCIPAPTNSKRHVKENRRKKRKAKTMRKSNRNGKTSEATSDEETAFYVHSSGDRDSETIEILTIDTETKKEKKKKRRKKAKRIVAKAGLTMWKGIRTGWKLMWDGLSMYTLPLGTLDVTTNITKFWSANNSSSARAY